MDHNTLVSKISEPWAVALLKDPDWMYAKTASRVPKASGEDSFFAETLATNRTIQALHTLKPVQELEEDFAYREIKEIAVLGDGLNGFPQICHGGFVATLLDEVCGVLIVLNMEKRMERLKKNGPAQPHTDMAYMTACTPSTIHFEHMTYERQISTRYTRIQCQRLVRSC